MGKGPQGQLGGATAQGGLQRLAGLRWPGQVAIDKGWIQAGGVDVRSSESGSTTRPDGGLRGQQDRRRDHDQRRDALVTAGGARSVMVMLTDYSNGSDMIIGKPGIQVAQKDLKEGKKVAVGLAWWSTCCSTA